jgi:hypothetical protein
MSLWNKFVDTVKENKIIIGSLAGVVAGIM